MKNRKLWKRLAKEGKFLSFRFESTAKQPTGLVFELKEGRVIIRAGDKGYLEIEPHW